MMLRLLSEFDHINKYFHDCSLHRSSSSIFHSHALINSNNDFCNSFKVDSSSISTQQ
jgi:hypothetical protein